MARDSRTRELGTRLFPGEQAALAQDLFAEFLFQAVAEEESGIGGVADAEAGDHFVVQAAAGEIFPGSRAFGAPQALLKKCDGALVDVEQLAAQAGFFGFAGSRITRLGQRDAELLGHQTHGFGEGDVFDFLDEAEDVAGDAAAEAVIELARGVHGK